MSSQMALASRVTYTHRICRPTQWPANPNSLGRDMNKLRRGMPLKYALRTSTKDRRCSTPLFLGESANLAKSIRFASSGGVEAK